jgi:hypothetical protein
MPAPFAIVRPSGSQFSVREVAKEDMRGFGVGILRLRLDVYVHYASIGVGILRLADWRRKIRYRAVPVLNPTQ